MYVWRLSGDKRGHAAGGGHVLPSAGPVAGRWTKRSLSRVSRSKAGCGCRRGPVGGTTQHYTTGARLVTSATETLAFHLCFVVTLAWTYSMSRPLDREGKRELCQGSRSRGVVVCGRGGVVLSQRGRGGEKGGRGKGGQRKKEKKRKQFVPFFLAADHSQ